MHVAIDFELNALRVARQLASTSCGPLNNLVFTTKDIVKVRRTAVTGTWKTYFTGVCYSMAKRKASPSGSSSDNIRVAPVRNIRHKTSHQTSTTTHSRGVRVRTVDHALIPQDEEPSRDELSTALEYSHHPLFERPLVIEGKRARKQSSRRLTLADPFESKPRPGREKLQSKVGFPTRISHTPPATESAPSPSPKPHLQPQTEATQHRTALAQARSNTPVIHDENSQDNSRSSSRRPRRSTARQSYAQAIENDEEDMIIPIKSSRKENDRMADAPTLDPDFESERSGQVSDSSEESEDEDCETKREVLDEGYDSGVKITQRRASKNTKQSAPVNASRASGVSKTGKRTGQTTATEMLKLLNREAGEPKGLDTGLPPLSAIDDIFRDVTAKALELGLKEILEATKRPLRVATICSGTESPLLALEMVQDALKALGAPELHVDHLFSVEIVPYKQAYIERNFHPKIIYRDITEMTDAIHDTIPTATTVYGSRVPIPGDVDIVIAGTSCVDLSWLNKHRKDLEAGGESGKTWFGVLSYVKAFRPAIVILENVKSAPYDRMMDHYRQIGYEVGGVLVDTKNYYLPQTRQRGYLVCFDKSKATAEDIKGAGKTWQDLMSKFRRSASSSVAEFMLPNDKIRAQQVSLDDSSKEYDWAACEIRHIQYRQEKRLGSARPLTFWSESGTMNVPENGFISWYRKQPERVRDYMDISLLRKASIFDVRYKTRIWDVSQNVDLFGDSTPFGITPCITPSGSFFASDAGRALAPEELLSLQGLPLSKVSFTTETGPEIQDLAGNAMSTTAVGPAILAALICGQHVMHWDETDAKQDSKKTAALLTKIADTKTRPVHDHCKAKKLDLSDLLEMAYSSARRCLCGGANSVTRNAILTCVDCDHTACSKCSGNPEHNYRGTSHVPRSSPLEFERHLRSHLPQYLAFAEDVALKSFAEVHDEHGYSAACEAAAKRTFTLSRVRRTHVWTAIYQAAKARLELRLDGQQASWHLFALTEQSLPVDNQLRNLLQKPIARSTCNSALLGNDWQWRSLARKEAEVKIEGAGKLIPSWLARLELPDYRNEQVSGHLSIHLPSKLAASLGHDLSGEYEALPLCGTANDSLYKKIVPKDAEPIYLLRNPTRTGDPRLDSFVFATDKERLDFGVDRLIIASLDPTWAPLSDKKSQKLTLLPAGHWKTKHTALREAEQHVTVHAPLSLENLQLDCKKSELILRCTFDSHNGNARNSHDVDPTDNKFFEQNAHILESMRRLLPSSDWRPLSLASSNCTSCAPRKPGLRWMLTETQAIKPYEDPVSAGIYERSIKSRPRPIVFKLNRQSTHESSIQFGLNLASLAHRAIARLPEDSECRLTWKLDQSLVSGDVKFSQFVLRPTEGSASPHDTGMRCQLYPKQSQVVHWMQQQELGQKFTIEEAEEAIVPALGWRAEVRAETEITVRGGICADHPGFGKTITSLALIHSHLEADRDIVSDLRNRQIAGGNCGLLAAQATLIVAPNTLVRQWVSEIKDKLGYTEGVLTVSSLKDLDKYSIEDFVAAKIILVNRTVLGHQDYAERLASFAAMPGPATNSGRAFSQWLAHTCKAVPEHLNILQDEGLQALRKHVQVRYAELVSSEDFQTIVPSRRLVGKDYVESKGKTSKSVKAASKALNISNLDRPLFEQFFFNRIIIDEFHQYTPREYASLKALKADKRWGLSGTPALTDFYDVAQIADVLGIPLRIGSDSVRTMADRNVKALRKNMTDFERFDAMRQTPSDCMNARIHEIAQAFLDTFVRQNVMDFGDMTCSDHLIPVTLDVDHQAAYTELSQQLASQEMNIRKAKKSKTTTRDKRFMTAIADLATAEEALSRDAAFFKRAGDLHKGLQHMIEVRQSEVDVTLRDLKAAIFAAQHDITEPNLPLQHMILALLQDGALGDNETIELIRSVLSSSPAAKALPRKTSSKKNSISSPDDSYNGSEKTTEGKEVSTNRELTAKVNALAKSLLISVRSKRYISNVRSIQKSCALTANCDSETCATKRNEKEKQNTAVSALCGHRVCQKCHAEARERHHTQCAAAGCNASQQDHHLLWSNTLTQTSSTSSNGAKIEAALLLLSNIQRKGEKAILFVQYDHQLSQVAAALFQRDIPSTIVDDPQRAGAKIASFCNQNNSSHNNSTVLVLNASHETAAGSNIQVANHVIFLSPLLRDHQYSYDSTMAQAIGRARRHGQKREIHVYRICALHTIDVDILEHREHRTSAMVQLGEEDVQPPIAARELEQEASPKGERVQLVKEEDKFSLRPRSWLYRCGVDKDREAMARVQGRGRVAGWEDFSSQVKFSRAFAGDVCRELI